MPAKLKIESKTEKRIANAAKIEAIKEINNIGFEEAAKKLDLSVTGLRRLIWPTEWKIAEAIRVAEALNLPIVKKLLNVVDESDIKPEGDTADYPDWVI